MTPYLCSIRMLACAIKCTALNSSQIRRRRLSALDCIVTHLMHAATAIVSSGTTAT